MKRKGEGEKGEREEARYICTVIEWTGEERVGNLVKDTGRCR